MIRVFDAFSGIGGFRSAFERVGGFKTVGWCEIDKFAQKSYRALFDTGGEQFYENIRDIDTAGLADFDLLVGGFPCQPFSVAGKRLGTADERGDLFFELARILEAKQPRYFIFENVPGLLGIEKGKTFQIILETLSELGYCVEWLVHDSAGFGGNEYLDGYSVYTSPKGYKHLVTYGMTVLYADEEAFAVNGTAGVMK